MQFSGEPKLHVVQPPGTFLSLHIFPTVTNRFFFFLFLFIFLSLHFISNSPTSIFLSTKTLYLSLIYAPFTISKISFSPKLSRLLQWNLSPRSPSSDMFNLTHQNGAVRLNKSLPLIFKPQEHLLENARAALVSFSNFCYF